MQWFQAFELMVTHEGRSVNKLQNDIIMLIFFLNMKIWKYTFLGYLIGDIYWNFY